MVLDNMQVSNQEWPSLGTEPQSGSSACDDGWELLVNTTEIDSADSSQGVECLIEAGSRTPGLSRSFPSTPNLGQESFLSAVKEDVGAEHGTSDESSLSVVHGPQSVISLSSSTEVFTFKDAILKNKEVSQEEPIEQQSPTKRVSPRRTIKPRFVVTPIKRSAKSTGDLPSLVEDDQDDAQDDANAEFYSRKNVGARSRSNGLKLRPDEAKRKQMIVNKKNIQRAANARR